MTENPFSARAITTQELAQMRAAVQMVTDRSEVSAAAVAPLVYALYCRGITDPVKLAEAAALLATSRAFH